MTEKTLTEVFGTGSSQTITEIIISKTGLAALLFSAGYTFTPTASNSVDQLLAAIVCAGLVALSPEERSKDVINRNLEFRYDPNINFSTITTDGQTFNQHTIELAFYKPVATPSFNPSDFT